MWTISVGPELFQAGGHTRPVANVEFVVLETLVRGQEPFLVPAGVAGRAEEIGPHIVVHPVDRPAQNGLKNATTSEPMRPEEPVTSAMGIGEIRVSRLAGPAQAPFVPGSPDTGFSSTGYFFKPVSCNRIRPTKSGL